jgi:chromatin segregation and condensation protein Rec8/ScpA/Scc1 (kleisin family)
VRLRDRIRSLVERLAVEDRVSFRGMIELSETRLEVVIDFLAVLELIKANYLRAEQAEAFSDIDLVRIEGAQPPSYTELAQDFDGA